MPDPVGIYLIWYGNWTNAEARGVIVDWANTIGGTDWWLMMTEYTDYTGARTTANASLAGQAFDSYSQGASLSDEQIFNVVARPIQDRTFPLDGNGVYIVMTSSDVAATSGFCAAEAGGYCGYHRSVIANGISLKFAFVGDPSGSEDCLAGCSGQPDLALSPNNMPGIDSMISTLSHELAEAASDPNLDAWLDECGLENADKCIGSYGATYTLPSGALANIRLGSRDFLIQENWVLSIQGCAMSIPPATTSPLGSTARLLGSTAQLGSTALPLSTAVGSTAVGSTAVASTAVGSTAVAASSATPPTTASFGTSAAPATSAVPPAISTGLPLVTSAFQTRTSASFQTVTSAASSSSLGTAHPRDGGATAWPTTLLFAARQPSAVLGSSAAANLDSGTTAREEAGTTSFVRRDASVVRLVLTLASPLSNETAFVDGLATLMNISRARIRLSYETKRSEPHTAASRAVGQQLTVDILPGPPGEPASLDAGLALVDKISAGQATAVIGVVSSVSAPVTVFLSTAAASSGATLSSGSSSGVSGASQVRDSSADVTGLTESLILSVAAGAGGLLLCFVVVLVVVVIVRRRTKQEKVHPAIIRVAPSAESSPSGDDFGLYTEASEEEDSPRTVPAVPSAALLPHSDAATRRQTAASAVRTKPAQAGAALVPLHQLSARPHSDLPTVRRTPRLLSVSMSKDDSIEERRGAVLVPGAEVHLTDYDPADRALSMPSPGYRTARQH